MVMKSFATAFSAVLIASFSILFGTVSAAVTKWAGSYVAWNDAYGSATSTAKPTGLSLFLPSWMDRSSSYHGWMDDSGNFYLASFSLVGDLKSDTRFEISVSKFDGNLSMVAFWTGNSVVMDSFSFPSNGNDANYPLPKVRIRVAPDGRHVVAWQSWSSEANSYVTKFSVLSGTGENLSWILGNESGTLSGLEFADMDSGSFIVSSYRPDARAKVWEVSSRNAPWVVKSMTVTNLENPAVAPFSCDALDSNGRCSAVVGLHGFRVAFQPGSSPASSLGKVPYVPIEGVANSCSVSYGNRPRYYGKAFVGRIPVEYVGYSYLNPTGACYSSAAIRSQYLVVSGKNQYATYYGWNASGYNDTVYSRDFFPQERGWAVVHISDGTSTDRAYYYSGFNESLKPSPVRELASWPMSEKRKLAANRKGEMVVY